MYIDRLALKNFRTFRRADVPILHPDHDFERLGLPRPELPNVNLLLGNNGSGKTALLKAIAIACMGPAIRSSGIYAYRLIRREPQHRSRKPSQPEESLVTASFTPHPQDDASHEAIESRITIKRRGDLEEFDWTHPDDKRWHPIFSESTDAFFCVAYGATRRVERRDRVDPASRHGSAFARAQRVQSLFEDAYSLMPLNAWLPAFRGRNKGRYSQVVDLINALMGEEHFRFHGDQENGEFVFDRGGLKIPFPALSDGYRAFLGWVGDLLYHVTMTCPPGKKLVDNHGIVMVDEIDLHLHPSWQMSVLPTIARALPHIQFIVTSHSPLIVGSLEWTNIILMKPAASQSSQPSRVEWAVHGLDADQVLLTDFFGLESTRAASKRRQMKELTLRARQGDAEAAKALLAQMSKGMEER